MLSELFYTLNFSFSIFASIIGILISTMTIVLIISHRVCRTVSNLMMANTCFASATFFANRFTTSIYGFRETWAITQPLCAFGAYCLMVSGCCICYSYLTQAVSRLFFAVFFKHKHLLGFRIHWYLIIASSFIGFLAPLPSLLIEGGYELDINQRLCLPAMNNAPTTVFSILAGFVIPLNLSIVIYYKIWQYAVQSSRRVSPSTTQTTTNSNMPNLKREMKLARNMIILLSIYACSGIPITIVIFWHFTNFNGQPPASLSLLASNSISFFVALMTIALFIMNKPVRNIGLSYLPCQCRLTNLQENQK